MDAYGSAVRAARCAAITARRGGLWRLCWGTAVEKRAVEDYAKFLVAEAQMEVDR